MITLYTIPESLYCAKIRILLRYKNLEWKELLPPGGYGSDEYKTYIPSGNLPALIDNHFFISDSEAIAEYIEETYPAPACLPNNVKKRAKIRELSRFHDTRLEPCLREYFCIFSGLELSRITVNDISLKLNKLLQQLDVLISDHIHNEPDQLTLADCGLPITLLWIEKLCPYLDIEITIPTIVTNYLNSINTIPAVKTELASYSPILDKFLIDEFLS